MEHKIDLNRLTLFCRVVEAGSFTKAALYLKQPKSRISRQISSLEKELGTQLIYRTTRQFQLTQNGRDLYSNARDRLEELQEIVLDLGKESSQVSGVIKMTCPEDIGQELIPEICSEFIKQYPQIRFDLLMTNTVIDLVKESVDVAIRVSQPRDSSMLMKKLGTVGMIVVASPQLLERYSTLTKVDDLLDIPCITFSTINSNQHWKLQSKKDKKSLKIQAVVSASNLIGVRALALHGLGVALLPHFLCAEALRRGDLVHILKDWSTEAAPLQILMPHQKEKSPKIKTFVEFLHQKLGREFN